MLFSDLETARTLERTEAFANRSFVEARARLEPESEACWIDVGGTYALFDGVGSPITQTFGLGMNSNPSDTDFDRIEEFFRSRGSGIDHEVSPLAGADLFGRLAERGYRPIELSSVLFMELESIRTSDTPGVSTRVVEGSEAEVWAATSARGWSTEAEGLEDFMRAFGLISANCKDGFPYLAEIDGTPIAAGMLFIFGEVAIIAGASTVPEGRRKGAQSALLSARLNNARSQGCRIAMMCALPGSQSQRNAERNGFHVAYTRTKWHLD